MLRKVISFYQKYMRLLTLSILKLPRKADGDRDTTIPPGGPAAYLAFYRGGLKLRDRSPMSPPVPAGERRGHCLR